jgi:rSAM/selenodomain-associated transferase 1
VTRSRQALLVFARAPVVGQAKTRLIPALGAAGAAALHAALVERTLQAMAGLSADLQLWCHPDPGHAFFRACATRFPLDLERQVGTDLGQRMAQALAAALARYDSAVLIGTDCPSLGADAVAQAFAVLQQGADVVLGPAADGGYYLVGLCRPQPPIFSGIDWGGDRVLSQTRSRLRQCRLDYRLLEPRQDLDTPADLAGLDDREALLRRGKQLVELD